MSRFYIVLIGKTRYKVMACALSMSAAAYTLQAVIGIWRHSPFVVRDGSTGKRYPIAHFIDTYYNKIKPEFSRPSRKDLIALNDHKCWDID